MSRFQELSDKRSSYILNDAETDEFWLLLGEVSSRKRAAEEKILRDKQIALEKKREQAINRQPKDMQTLIRKNKIQLGMNKEQVTLSWGRPEKINESVGRWGVHEQWVYGSGTYLYFENGVLTSWQGTK
jgi:hypothetical protein